MLTLNTGKKLRGEWEKIIVKLQNNMAKYKLCKMNWWKIMILNYFEFF